MKNNKQIREGRRRLNAEQRLLMVEEFRRSSLTRRAFAQQHGVALATLAWWLKKAKSESKLPTPVVFREFSLPAQIIAPTSVWAMEVANRDGLTVRCREALSLADLVHLLRG